MRTQVDGMEKNGNVENKGFNTSLPKMSWSDCNSAIWMRAKMCSPKFCAMGNLIVTTMVAEADVYLFHRASGDNFGRRPGCIHSEHSRNIFTFFLHSTIKHCDSHQFWSNSIHDSNIRFCVFFVFISFYCSTVYKNRNRTKKSKHRITSTAFCLLEQPHAQL